MLLRIDPNGAVRFVHDDLVVDQFVDDGVVHSRRASTCEPVTVDGQQQWEANLSLSGGPRFVSRRRREAIAAEIEWLEAEGLPRG